MHDLKKDESAAVEVAKSIGLLNSPEYLMEGSPAKKLSLAKWRLFLSHYTQPRKKTNTSLSKDKQKTNPPATSRDLMMTGFSEKRNRPCLRDLSHTLVANEQQEGVRAQTARTSFRTGLHSRDLSMQIHQTDINIQRGLRSTQKRRSVLKNMMSQEYCEQKKSDQKKLKKRNFSVKMKFNHRSNHFEFVV